MRSALIRYCDVTGKEKNFTRYGQTHSFGISVYGEAMKAVVPRLMDRLPSQSVSIPADSSVR